MLDFLFTIPWLFDNTNLKMKKILCKTVSYSWSNFLSQTFNMMFLDNPAFSIYLCKQPVIRTGQETWHSKYN